MSTPHHHFNIGDRIIIVAEKNLFGLKDELLKKRAEEVLPMLHFVQLTIKEERLVKGDYKPEEKHYGYLAAGDDGWDYECQWDYFDDASTDPYCNWQRHFIKDKHYVSKDDHTEFQWLIPREQFDGHYLNWDIRSVHRHIPPVLLDLVLHSLNEKYLDNQVFICDKSHTNKGDTEEKHHKVYGLQYVNHGCFMCNFVFRFPADDHPL